MNSYPTTELPFVPELLKLVGGQPIALRFTARNKLLLLTPGALYGFDDNILVIAGVGEKCGLIDLRDINVTPMIRAGLSAHAATVLKSELERTYQNANTKTHEHEASPSTARRKTRTGSRHKGKKAEQPGNGSGRKRASRGRTKEGTGPGKRA